jgi:putative endonuclease
MKFYYVYILRCIDHSLYTKITNNIERRLNKHNDGMLKNAYTYKRRPVVLEFYQEFTEPNQAIYFEKKIKKMVESKERSFN